MVNISMSIGILKKSTVDVTKLTGTFKYNVCNSKNMYSKGNNTKCLYTQKRLLH